MHSEGRRLAHSSRSRNPRQKVTEWSSQQTMHGRDKGKTHSSCHGPCAHRERAPPRSHARHATVVLIQVRLRHKRAAQCPTSCPSSSRRSRVRRRFHIEELRKESRPRVVVSLFATMGPGRELIATHHRTGLRRLRAGATNARRWCSYAAQSLSTELHPPLRLPSDEGATSTACRPSTHPPTTHVARRPRLPSLHPPAVSRLRDRCRPSIASSCRRACTTPARPPLGRRSARRSSPAIRHSSSNSARPRVGCDARRRSGRAATL